MLSDAEATLERSYRALKRAYGYERVSDDALREKLKTLEGEIKFLNTQDWTSRQELDRVETELVRVFELVDMRDALDKIERGQGKKRRERDIEEEEEIRPQTSGDRLMELVERVPKDIWVLLVARDPTFTLDDLSSFCAVSKRFNAVCPEIYQKIFQRQAGIQLAMELDQLLADVQPFFPYGPVSNRNKLIAYRFAFTSLENFTQKEIDFHLFLTSANFIEKHTIQELIDEDEDDWMSFNEDGRFGQMERNAPRIELYKTSHNDELNIMFYEVYAKVDNPYEDELVVEDLRVGRDRGESVITQYINDPNDRVIVPTETFKSMMKHLAPILKTNISINHYKLSAANRRNLPYPSRLNDYGDSIFPWVEWQRAQETVSKGTEYKLDEGLPEITMRKLLFVIYCLISTRDRVTIHIGFDFVNFEGNDTKINYNALLMGAPIGCISCGNAQAALCERKTPQRVFCNRECQAVFNNILN